MLELIAVGGLLVLDLNASCWRVACSKPFFSSNHPAVSVILVLVQALVALDVLVE
ncbi:hypothetical protein A2U01_0068586, partial [Trifolium medium]|nr:hypothetical protein [Trifolium medium]